MPTFERMAGAEVVAADDDELVPGAVAQAFDQAGAVGVRHVATLPVAVRTGAGQAPHRPRPARRASSTASAMTSA